MNVSAVIAAKRDGLEIAGDDIRRLIDGYTRDEVPEYQMSAFAMAVYFRGMTVDETTALTAAMLGSGRTMKWAAGSPVVDKHSTGGVGDKISIPLAPILADLGMRVPMISGRGLGATGGTIDKLESIPGFRTDLSLDEIDRVVGGVGCVITAASADIAPADRRLYALRDVTGTVPSIPLITASILSKKIAEGLDALVLDVKWGSGAFMKTLDDARALAKSLVNIASKMGVRTTAVITDMNRPLGHWIGNTAEVNESIDILKGQGPEDTTRLTELLAEELLLATGLSKNRDEANARVRESVSSGRATERLENMVRAQAGDLNKTRILHASHPWNSPRTGIVGAMNCELLGMALIEMGGGRKKLGDQVDSGSAIEVLLQPGEQAEQGQPVVNLCFNQKPGPAVTDLIVRAIPIVDQAPTAQPLVVETIQSE